MAKGKNLVSFFIPALVIGLVLLLIVGFALYFLGIQQPLQNQAKQLLSSRMTERANLVEQRFEQIQEAVNLASLASSSLSDANLIVNVKKQIPQLTEVKIFSQDEIDIDLQSQPIVTHVTVDMLRKALAGNPPPPEMILHEGQSSYIAFVQKLSADKVILASLSALEARKLLGQAESGSYIELRQSFNNVEHTVAAVGEGKTNDAPLVLSPVFGAGWSIALWQTSDSFLTEAGALPVLLLIGALVALLIAALMPYFSLQRILNADARGFIQGINNRKLPSTFKLKFFNDLAASYKRLNGQATVNTNYDPEPIVSEEPVFEQVDVPSKKTENTYDVDLQAVSENINPDIFREYDIRGIADKELTQDTIFTIGKAIGSEAYARGEQKVIVARDGRLSSPLFHRALIEGLKRSGRDVIDLGAVATPILYFATHALGSRSGIMITGSHNPPSHNGLKIVLAGETLYGRDIKALYNRIKDNDFLNGSGQVSEVQVEENYLAKLIEDIQLERPLKLVVDCGNGITGDFAPRMFQALGCEVIGLYTDVDGNFPNHHPDPNSSKNLQELIATVKREHADIGFAFDGDGDRLGIVDNSGKIIWTDRVLMLFAMDVLSRNNGADILYDVKCTRHLSDIIKQHGGVPVMWKTGHSLMKAKMKETGALLGGEGSGHIYFKERWFGFDDAYYAAARLLEILAKDNRTAQQVFEVIPESVASEEINVPIPDKVKFKLINALIKKGIFAGANINTIDGIRVEYDDRWLLARASNTTPSIVVKFEADNELALEKVKSQLKEQLLAIAPKLKLHF